MLKVEAAYRQPFFDRYSGTEITVPYFGSLWEATVKLIKTHLLKVVGNINLTYEDLLNKLAQVNMYLNS